MIRTKLASGGICALLIVLLAACQGGFGLLPKETVLQAGIDNLAGVVTSSRGPEAGVWVIAETTDLPTKFAKIVVTDDRGRFLMPDLPKASYQVWVRGYGLVDSAKTSTPPGKRLDL